MNEQEKKQNELPEINANELSEEGFRQSVDASSMETQDVTSEEANDASDEIDASSWQSAMNDGLEESEPPPEEHDDFAEAMLEDAYRYRFQLPMPIRQYRL